MASRDQQLTPAEVVHRQRVRRLDEKMKSFRRAAGILQGTAKGREQPDVKTSTPFYEVYSQVNRKLLLPPLTLSLSP